MAKLVNRFEIGSLLAAAIFRNAATTLIPAKRHCPKGDRINESLLYMRLGPHFNYNRQVHANSYHLVHQWGNFHSGMLDVYMHAWSIGLAQLC